MSVRRKLRKNEKGGTAIEYGLIVALVAVAAIGALTAVGGGLNTTFGRASGPLTAVSPEAQQR
ncbi:MAG TPA: Flp family type IVb pilin [Allosphingosinicella sp.]|nr:Flp family type IVb pilin [Allosphingosinicella sp.]